MNFKIPGAIYLPISFTNIEKRILTNLKLFVKSFVRHPFFKYLKSILTNLNIRGIIFSRIPFSSFQKNIVTNLKISGAIFLHFPSWNISILANLKISCAFCCSSHLQILKKKRTYKSKDYSHNFLTHPFFKY